jgi:hypothetical protein
LNATSRRHMQLRFLTFYKLYISELTAPIKANFSLCYLGVRIISCRVSLSN